MAQKKSTRKTSGAKTSPKSTKQSRAKSSLSAKKKKPSKPTVTSRKKNTLSGRSTPAKKKSSKASTVQKVAKPRNAKPAKSQKPASKVTPPVSKGLSAHDRYNAGGLLACAIDRDRDPGSRKLRKALHALQLSRLEQDNIVRLSQGLTIPKLFADGILDEATRRMVVAQVVKFAKGEGQYERDWKDDVQRFSTWLGVPID